MLVLSLASLAAAKVRFYVERNDHDFATLVSLEVVDDGFDAGKFDTQAIVPSDQQIEWNSDAVSVHFDNVENTIVYNRAGLSTKYQLHGRDCDTHPDKRELSAKRAAIRMRDPKGPGDGNFPHIDMHFCWWGGKFEDRIWGP